MSTHTQTPWKLAAFDHDDTQVCIIACADGRDLPIAAALALGDDWDNEESMPNAEANAAHIVRCVNSHDALLAACKAAEPVFADAVPACIAARIPGWQKLSDVRDKLRDAVKLAEGQG